MTKTASGLDIEERWQLVSIIHTRLHYQVVHLKQSQEIHGTACIKGIPLV